jgi:hypothetical protein
MEPPVCGIPPQGPDNISKPGDAEKTTGGRGSPVVKNPPKEFSVTESPFKS